MSNTLLIKYYADGKFKDASGVSIFQSSNAQSEIAFKFDEDIGDSIVFANIKIPYANGSNLYGQYQTQSLIMNKEIDEAGGYIYRGVLLRPYLVTSGRAYINAQVQASEGLYQYENQGATITINGVPYTISIYAETFNQVSYDLVRLTNTQTGEVYTQQNLGVITVAGQVLCIKNLIVSVVNGDFNGTLVLTSGVEVKNYQQVEFKITGSAPYYAYYPLIPEESAVIMQRLGTQGADITNLQANKQNVALDPATISAIQGIITSGNAPVQVEPALIDLFTRTQANLVKNNTQDQRLSDAEQDIDDIKRTQVTGIRVIGVYTAHETLPTSAELDQFRIDSGYDDVTGGDVIYIKLEKENTEDEFYIATYSLVTHTWTETQIQFMENASNNTKGVVQGTGTDTSDTTKIIFDINNGIITDALAYRNGAWVSIRSYLTAIDQIIDGTIIVKKAEEDAVGNNIQGTYQTKNEGASKAYVKQYASPRIVNDIYYFDFSDDTLKPQAIDNASPKTAPINTLLDNPIGNFVLNLPQDLVIGNKNGFMVSGFVQSASAIEGRIKVSVYYALQSEAYATEHHLGTEMTDETQFATGVMLKAEINTYFDQLNDALNLSAGDRIIVKLSFYTETTYNTTLDFIANDTYKSVAFLDRLSYVQYVVETNDYDQLNNKPVLNLDLNSVADLTDLPTYQLYRHIGLSNATYLTGMLYFRKANESVMTALYNEWVDSAEFSDGTSLTRSGNTIIIPVATPSLIPFIDLDDIMDTTPTQGSTKPITSGGVYDALQNVGGGGLTLKWSGELTLSGTLQAIGSLTFEDGKMYRLILSNGVCDILFRSAFPYNVGWVVYNENGNFGFAKIQLNGSDSKINQAQKKYIDNSTNAITNGSFYLKLTAVYEIATN